jgi:hypothetical protein
MDERLSPPGMGHGGPGRIRPWTRMALGLLLLTGTLIQACSDNNGSTGPTFACRESASGQSPTRSGSVRLAEGCPASPAPVIGDGSGSLGVLLTVAVDPSTVDIGRRASVTVVATSTGGFRLSGQREVIVTTSVGSLDASSGTMVDGVFRTTLFIPCGAAAGAGTVHATVSGAVSPATTGTFTAVTAASNNPCPVVVPAP